ncbi:MAG: hypothetical protein ACTSPY_12760 [Candidatus Helarchaeota archaeon]
MIGFLIRLFVVAFIVIIIILTSLLILNMGDTYVNLAASRGFILFLFKLAHIPVKIFNHLTPSHLYVDWEIETNPPKWLPKEVINFKNQFTWKDRAFFWHLLLRSGTLTVYKNLGNKFLPQLIAVSIINIFKTIWKVLLNPFYYMNRFKKHPIKTYLEFAGSISGSTINWICNSKYKEEFIKNARKAGFPIGYYYGKKYLKDPIFRSTKNDALKAMQLIMVVYVLFGLVGWERHIYPKFQPKVEIHSENEVTVSFSGNPYKCPHRGLKCFKICQCFVSWEDGLVNAINPNLTSYVTKSLAAGDSECEVIITKKKK